MKERIEVIDFKYKVTMFTFFFFFLISTLSPISGSDWWSYLTGKEGLGYIIKNININDGRILSGVLIGVLSYNKLIFNVFFSLLMSMFVRCCNNMMGIVKNKYYYLFPLLGTMLVSVFLFSYNYVSVSTTVTYTFPAILSFIYFEYLWKKDNYTFNVKDCIFLSIISLIICLSSIHIAITFFLGNLIYYIYSIIKKKKISKSYIAVLIIQLIAITFSLSILPKELFYNNFNKILSNIPRYIDTFFSKNILLVILGAIPINYYLSKKLKGWIYDRVVITLFDSILLFSLAYNFFYYSPVNLNLVINKYLGVFATENWYYIFYFIIYLILLFLSINDIIKEKKIYMMKILYIMGIVSSIFLLISPLWDEGNVIFFVLFLIFIISIMLKELNIKIYPKTTILILIVMILYYIGSFAIIKYIDITREEYIIEQLEANEKNIEIKASPIYLVWRYNPVTIFQQKDFKRYYNIPQDKNITVKYFGIFEKIEKKVKE